MLWIKTFHILFVMAWMAGVFYLPRILVHYVEGKAAAEDTRRLVTMAEKLLKFSTIMAALAITLGLLLWLYYGVTGGWMHAKLLIVVLVLGYHHACGRLLRKFVAGTVTRGHVWFRWFNEVPVVLLLVAVVLVVVKPV